MLKRVEVEGIIRAAIHSKVNVAVATRLGVRTEIGPRTDS
jgi:hypothetical protein